MYALFDFLPGWLSTQTDKASLCPCTVINNLKVTFIVINLYEVKEGESF